MQIKLSDHFTYNKLLRFTLPSIFMMIFTSIYGMVDGFFVSNYVGKTAFASVNLIMPYLQILGGFGAMIGVGGSALVAKTLGEGKEDQPIADMQRVQNEPPRRPHDQHDWAHMQDVLPEQWDINADFLIVIPVNK